MAAPLRQGAHKYVGHTYIIDWILECDPILCLARSDKDHAKYVVPAVSRATIRGVPGARELTIHIASCAFHSKDS